MQILPKQISIFGETEWTSLQADSPAKMQVRQSRWEEKDNSDLKEKGPDYGGTCAGRLMKSVHDGLLQKTLPISQELTTEEILQKSSIRFPNWGTMLNGRLCTLQTQARPKKSQVLPGCLLRQRPITGGRIFLLRCMQDDCQGAQAVCRNIFIGWGYVGWSTTSL